MLAGGHSLGGSMAAQYIAGNPAAIRGLAFWAAYAATDLPCTIEETASPGGEKSRFQVAGVN